MVNICDPSLAQDPNHYLHVLVELLFELLGVLVVENVPMDATLHQNEREEDVVDH